jgi:type III restriction enzyme
MFALKDYQQKALAALDTFFFTLRTAGLEAAWQRCAPVQEKNGQRQPTPYNKNALGEVPAVCVRIPTGGGKTFLAAHAIAKAGQRLRDSAAPVSLWLVPSDAIRRQTLAALNAPRNLCRAALSEHFGERVRVCALEDLATVGAQEVGHSAIIIVATIQSFNVKDKTIRTVYDFDETLAPHFHGLTAQQAARLDRVNETDIAKQTFLSAADLGRVKTSLANWLKLHQPIVVVDEAHNNRTEQAFCTLRNLHPACLIELTATPMADSNVIFHVGAQALAREDMIKLPIVLIEHPTGWKDAVRDAILSRDRLELWAAQEADYIRPLLLFQAEAKNGEVTVAVLLQHLTSADGEKIDRQQIAIATGEQKELDGIVLADPHCPIRFVITVEALKEGWDCPFAYVLCSLQNAKSAKDVEQLLGRVLRMPYARSRQHPELGKAYAHIVAQGFAQVANALIDGLVNNMGFDAYEAVQAIVPFLPQGEGAGSGEAVPQQARSVIALPALPLRAVPEALQACLEIRPTMNGATAIVRGELSAAVDDFLLSAYKPGKQQASVQQALEREHLRLAALQAPSTRGIPFAPLPQLCLHWEDDWQPVEQRLLAELGEFDLFAEPLQLAGFTPCENGTAFEIDLEGGKVMYRSADIGQLHLNEVSAHATESDVVRWLDRACHQPDIAQVLLIKWLLALLRHLIADRGIPLTALLRAKYPLAEAVRQEIERRRARAIQHGFQKSLAGFFAAPQLADHFRYSFTFLPNQYPAHPPFYAGRYQFLHHYYPVIHDLRATRDNGTPAEEFVCAQAIDNHRQIKHWVRNVPKDKRFSFWLPTATDYFYPDFVCELIDGRLLVIEYKGEHLMGDDSREKAQIGQQWAQSSSGRCLFLLAVAKDKQGRAVMQQITHTIANAAGGRAGDPHG